MIESRYKIEYILPDEDIKKTSPFRMLWYVLLIPLVILVVTAIAYDFSFKNLSNDSIALFKNMKADVLNLGDKQQGIEQTQPINIEVKKNIVAKSIVPNKTINKPIVTATEVITKPVTKINQDKITISELTAKQEQQLNAIRKQIAKNTSLTNDLNQLSEKLVFEQIKNQELSSKLAEQEQDKIELEQQLNTMLENSEDNKVTLEDLNIEADQETAVTLKPVTIKDGKAPAVQLIVEDVATTFEEIPKAQSETDKIIEAMATIASDNNKKINADIEAEKSAVIVKSEIQAETEKASLEKIVISAPEVTEAKENQESSATPDKNTETKDIIEINEPLISLKAQEEEELETSLTKANESSAATEPQEKGNADSEITATVNKETIKQAISDEKTKKPSAVDAIIAAMQESQSNSVSETTSGNKQKIDPELEKDIKRQLVEKGELSINKQ